jgi:hypothetical protein
MIRSVMVLGFEDSGSHKADANSQGPKEDLDRAHGGSEWSLVSRHIEILSFVQWGGITEGLVGGESSRLLKVQQASILRQKPRNGSESEPKYNKHVQRKNLDILYCRRPFLELTYRKT